MAIYSPTSQCRNKRTYMNKSEAKRAIKRTMSGANTQGQRTPMIAYKCPHCGSFHIGHDRK